SRIPQLVAENLGPLLFLTRTAGDVYALLAPEAPIVQSPPFDSDGTFEVQWQHTDTLNPAVSYELAELRGLSVITDSANVVSGWANDGFAVSTSRSNSAPSSFYSNSGDDLANTITSSNPYLVQAGDTLRFQTWYDIELDWDYAYVEISTDGVAFTPIAGNITTESDPHGVNRGHGITGSSSDWTEGVFDLSAYVGQSVFFRFLYDTDGSVTEEGIYIDDVSHHLVFQSETTIASALADTSYEFTSKPGGVYYYRVRAKDAQDQWGAWSDLSITEVDDIPFYAGDIDLDGVSSTIADLVLFTEYFSRGLVAFTINPEAQIAQTDINCDGTVLSVADLVALVRIVSGDMQPCYDGVFKTGDNEVFVDYDRPTRATAARNPADGTPPSFALQIEDTHFQFSDTGWVNIVLTDIDTGLTGYTLNLRYDTIGLELLEAQPGELLTNWNTFVSRTDSYGDIQNLRIVATATHFNEPGTVTVDDIVFAAAPVTLVRLKFRVTDPSSPLEKELRFAWEKCGDNAIAYGHFDTDALLDGLMLHRAVFSADSTDITGTDPVYGGASDCIGAGIGGVPPISDLDFKSGTLTFSPSCCIGFTGNVDCNDSEGADIADLTELISHLYIAFDALCCEQEAETAIPADGTIDVGDLTALIDHLFINFTDLPSCP
ncbi:MAG: immune inhibitor A, partial [candidate division Zixibacteria bacterium]|nr:immune inhibitor A [candidate division Zixibacteria bacterium]